MEYLKTLSSCHCGSQSVNNQEQMNGQFMKQVSVLKMLNKTKQLAIETLTVSVDISGNPFETRYFGKKLPKALPSNRLETIIINDNIRNMIIDKNALLYLFFKTIFWSLPFLGQEYRVLSKFPPRIS